jgi:hypothetical protein
VSTCTRPLARAQNAVCRRQRGGELPCAERLRWVQGATAQASDTDFGNALAELVGFGAREADVEAVVGGETDQRAAAP